MVNYRSKEFELSIRRLKEYRHNYFYDSVSGMWEFVKNFVLMIYTLLELFILLVWELLLISKEKIDYLLEKWEEKRSSK